MYMFFSFFSLELENKLLGKHQTSFLPAEALDSSELKTPLVYTFFPPFSRCSLHHSSRHFWGIRAFSGLWQAGPDYHSGSIDRCSEPSKAMRVQY